MHHSFIVFCKLKICISVNHFLSCRLLSLSRNVPLRPLTPSPAAAARLVMQSTKTDLETTVAAAARFEERARRRVARLADASSLGGFPRRLKPRSTATPAPPPGECARRDCAWSPFSHFSHPRPSWHLRFPPFFLLPLIFSLIYIQRANWSSPFASSSPSSPSSTAAAEKREGSGGGGDGSGGVRG